MPFHGSRVGFLIALVAVGSLTSCTPATPNPPAGVEDADVMELRQAALEELAESLGIVDPPEVALTRFVDQTEWPTTQVECLQAAGYPAKLMEDGRGVDLSEVPPAQATKGSPLLLARYVCEAQYSTDPRDAAGLTDGQLSALYDLYNDVQVPCLEAEGVKVNPPPSRQEFIDTYETEELWFPWASVDPASMSDDDWNALNVACPQEIDTSDLN